jgi:hypothetical protein
MNIVEEFINQNEQPLNQLTEENPQLGAAIVEALAVISFYSKSNNVKFDEDKKAAILTPVEIAAPKVEETPKDILEKIDLIVSENQPSVSQPTQTEAKEEMKWVVDTPSLSYASAVWNMLEKSGNPALYREANGRYYIIADNKIEPSPTSLNLVKVLIRTQVQLPMSEIDRVTLPPASTEITPPSVETTMPTTPETPTATTPIVHESKEFVEDDILVSQEDLDALKQLENLEDLGDINLDDLDLDNLDDLDI